MKAQSLASRAFILVVSTVLLGLSGSLAWATVNDFQSRGVVPQGVTIAGTQLGDLTAAEARIRIEDVVQAPLLRPVTVRAGGREFTLEPKAVVTVDVDGMLAAAYAPRRATPFIDRLQYGLSGAGSATDIAPSFTIDRKKLVTWVRGVASHVDSAPVDANMRLVDGAVTITHSSMGHRLDTKATVSALTSALDAEKALSTQTARTLSVAVSPVAPRVTEKTFGKVIVVDLSQRTVNLFAAMKLDKTYPCAIGTSDHPTPRGSFKIVEKRFMPTWRNPGSEWAKTMPAFIAPGPGSPLGTRALNLDASGIRIHGTSSDFSIGAAASHGCLRMHMWDIEDLYPRVPVGTPVFIIR